MANLYDDFDHLWLFNEASGPMIDTIGTRDSTSIVGAPTYNGGTSGVTFDNVDDGALWNTANAPFDFSADFTNFFKWRFDFSVDGFARFFYSPTSPGNGMPFYWDDVNVVNKFRLTDGIATTITIDANRLPTAGEIFTFGFSWVNSTKTIKWVFKSENTASPLDLSGTQVLTLIPADIGQKININPAGSIYTGLTAFRQASIDGTAASIEDMQDTIDAGFQPDPEPAPPPSEGDGVGRIGIGMNSWFTGGRRKRRRRR